MNSKKEYRAKSRVKKYRSTRSKRKDKRRRLTKSKRGGTFSDVKNTMELNLRDKPNKLNEVLKSVCKNPDNCLALGYYGEVIKQYFDNFRNLSYVDRQDIKRLGAPSNNGFVLELPFRKNDYTAYTVLKCASSADSDNLFYEYYVGKYFINELIKQFPCFVETYDCYEIANRNTMRLIQSASRDNTFLKILFTKDIQLTDALQLKNVVENNLNEFGNSCLKNSLNTVLIQHFDKFNTFADTYKNNSDNIKHEVLNIFYQLYFPLACLGDRYTHYDLHASNVCLYKPYDGKQYIQMKYHSRGQVYEFPSEYVVKIIDYGRNYFNNGKTDTGKIVAEVCKSLKCKPNCGEEQGYSILQGDYYDPNADFNYIMPNKPNTSHDLLLANNLKPYFDGLNMYNTFFYKTKYGTPPTTRTETYATDRNVYTMKDFVMSMESVINTINQKKIRKKYDSTWVCVAVMEIYDDGRDYSYTVLTAPTHDPAP